MSYAEHKREANDRVACAVVTVSDTRTQATDKSGAMIKDSLAADGHSVCHYEIVPDEASAIRSAIERAVARPECDAVLLTGGTGIAPRDGTPEVVAAMLDKRLDGFGELFRMLSYQEIGSGGMLSRAVAGIAGQKLIFSIPGSTNAVNLAMTKLILPELSHLVYELRK